MPELHVKNMRVGYPQIADWILSYGEEVWPRGLRTYEIFNAMIHVEDPADALPVGINRKGYSTRFAALEAAQLVGGVSDVPLTLTINPNMEQFVDVDSEGTRHFHGAYGPRVRYGLQAAVERLKEDPHTRQAVVTIFDADKDLTERWRDVPCTLSLHLAIRQNRLLLTTHMRSNDLWWGLAYDAFQFTQLQLTVANVLGIEPGVYTHVADSLHIYERDMVGVAALRQPTDAGASSPLQAPRGFIGHSIYHAQERARMMILGAEPTLGTERWYSERLHGGPRD